LGINQVLNVVAPILKVLKIDRIIAIGLNIIENGISPLFINNIQRLIKGFSLSP
jgi:hypothetical protein